MCCRSTTDGRTAPAGPPGTGRTAPGSESGVALLVTVLLVVVVTLLGLSFSFLADLERRLSRASYHRELTLQATRSAALLVKDWLDDPDGGFLVPSTSQVNRALRRLDLDGDGTHESLQDGSDERPIYKQIDDDLFDKPFRGSDHDAFVGSRDGPDVRISRDGTPDERAFLDALSAGAFGSSLDGGLALRIEQVDLYAPPTLSIGGGPVRFGIATAEVRTGLYSHVDGAGEMRLADATARIVINEMPYQGATGPIQSCLNISASGDFTAYWGTASAVNDGTFNVAAMDTKLNSGFPWSSLDQHISGTDLTSWLADPDASLEDPWFKLEVGNVLNGGPWQDAPSPIVSFDPLAVDKDRDHTNVFQRVPDALCPTFDYDTWKSIALTGGRNVHYLAYDAATGLFRLDGSGTPTSFETLTHASEGIFFFDTVDGLPPRDGDGDGVYDNLTPAIDISGTWYTGGFIYLNAASFKTTGTGNPPVRQLLPPGEPFVDDPTLSGGVPNNRYDDGELHLNLVYPTSLNGNPSYDLDPTTPTSTAVADYDDAGLPLDERVSVYGVLYTNGAFNAKGNAVYFGSIVAQDVGSDGAVGGTPDIYFDERLIKDEWPPPDLELPRVTISRWEY